MLIPKVQHIKTLCSAVNQSFYVTTPIFYVNAAPHIGHLYSAVIADAICRYEKIRHPECAHVITLSTGTDEHGTKVQQAAVMHNMPIEQYCNNISSRYRSVFQQASVQNTDYVRTTDERHKKAVVNFWESLRDKGYIYSQNYKGWYCVSDETFLTESQLRLDETLGQKFSLESGHPVEWTEEPNYMFRLSKLQSEILHWLKQGGRVKPLKFEKILFDMLAEPLPDISISRPAHRVPWAIPVPNDPTQTIYVWLDALVNYLTSAGYPDRTFLANWPPKVQVIGKDILKFHGIFWPAFLIAADIEPPEQLFVHSHWTVNGEKMSKSKNNVVDPLVASELYTMEGLRYFLLREGVAHSDGNYNSVKATRILNAELADTLGNLLSRVCAKSLNPRQIYPRIHTAQLREILKTDSARHLWDLLEQLDAKCTQHYNDRNFHMVADCVMATLHAANSFFEYSRPWELKLKTIAAGANRINIPMPECDHNALRLETILAMTMDTLRLCGIVLQPLLPSISTRLLDKLGVPWGQRLWRNLKNHFGLVANNVAEPPLEGCISHADTMLFERIYPPEDDDTSSKQKQRQKQQSKKTKAKKSKVQKDVDDKEVVQ